MEKQLVGRKAIRGKNAIYADFSLHKSNKVLPKKSLHMWYFFYIINIRLYISSFMCSIHCQLIAFPFLYLCELTTAFEKNV